MSAVASKSTLRATPAISNSVASRTAQARLEALHLRVDAEPGSGQAAALGKVEQHIIHGRLAQAGEMMETVARALDERAEAARVSERLGETVALNTARGEEQEGQGTGEVRVLSRDGLLWLKSKQRMTGSPLLGALRYRTDWTVVHSGEVRISQPGGSSRGGIAQERSVLRAEAVSRITAAHQQALHRDPALIALVEAVCGRGDTLMDLAKGDKHLARALEIELGVACRLLARHYGIG